MKEKCARKVKPMTVTGPGYPYDTLVLEERVNLGQPNMQMYALKFCQKSNQHSNE